MFPNGRQNSPPPGYWQRHVDDASLLRNRILYGDTYNHTVFNFGNPGTYDVRLQVNQTHTGYFYDQNYQFDLPSQTNRRTDAATNTVAMNKQEPQGQRQRSIDFTYPGGGVRTQTTPQPSSSTVIGYNPAARTSSTRASAGSAARRNSRSGGSPPPSLDSGSSYESAGSSVFVESDYDDEMFSSWVPSFNTFRISS